MIGSPIGSTILNSFMSEGGPAQSSNQFKVGPHTYELTIGISDGYGRNDTLETTSVQMFSFDNRMNRLYNIGFIEYVDDKAIVDKFIESDSTVIDIIFQKKMYVKSGDIIIETTEDSISLRFLLDGSEILSNVNNVITYRLNIISESYLSLNKSVRYSTYGKAKKSPTYIIQSILNESIGIGTSKPSFDENGSQTSINYITNNNDDGFSSIKYLLNKTIYNKDQKDNSLKSLIYSQESNTVFLFDTAAGKNRMGMYNPIEIQVVKNAKFPGYKSPTNMGYMNKCSMLNGIVGAQSLEYTKYDLNTNAFETTTLLNKQILDLINGNSKPGKINKQLGQSYSRYEAEWNNNIDLYDKIFETMTQTNGLIVNQEGLIGASAGFSCQVTIPNGFQSINNKKTTKEQEESKYQTITGLWDVYEVENFISPMQGIFRQKLILYRTSKV